MDFKVLQKMNPISTMKTIGTDHCKLYTDEKIKIIKYTRELGPLIINKCLEVYGACRHRTMFHHFPSDGTNEATQVAERANYPYPHYNSINRYTISSMSSINNSTYNHSQPTYTETLGESIENHPTVEITTEVKKNA